MTGWRCAKQGRAGLKTVRKVRRNAQQALLPPPTVAPLLSQGLAADWQRYQPLEPPHHSLVAQAARLVPHSVRAVLLSVPGLSSQLIARYLAGITDVPYFLSADQIGALAGLDPVFEQSGAGSVISPNTALRACVIPCFAAGRARRASAHPLPRPFAGPILVRNIGGASPRARPPTKRTACCISS